MYIIYPYMAPEFACEKSLSTWTEKVYYELFFSIDFYINYQVKLQIIFKVKKQTI